MIKFLLIVFDIKEVSVWDLAIPVPPRSRAAGAFVTQAAV